MPLILRENGIENRFFVTLAPPSPVFPDLDERAAMFAARNNGRVIYLFDPLMNAFAVEVDSEDARRLAEEPGVLRVEQDRPLLPLPTVYEELRLNPRSAQIFQVPSWGLDRIDQEKPPLNHDYAPPASGQSVRVYVVDSGVNDPGGVYFGPRLVQGFSHDGTGTSDEIDHGTAVAAIVGSTLFGVAPGSVIVPVRISSPTDPGGAISIGAGVAWAVRDAAARAAVINISVTVDECESLNDLIDKASISVICVAAAGNSGADASYYSPGSAASAVTIAASTIDEDREFIWPETNYGRSVALFAPGDQISSISNTGFPCETLAGTSFSAPFVSGAAAIYLELNVASTPAEVKSALIANSSRGLILDVPVGTENRLLWVR